MKLSNTLISRIAAAAMAISMAQTATVALAQEEAPATDPAATTIVAPVPDAAIVPPAVTQAEPAAATVQGQGTGQLVSSWSVQANPHLPLPLIAGLGGAYALFCLYAASRRMRGSWLRAGAGAALVLTLVNPELLQEQREPLVTEVAIVVDKSASQNIDGRNDATALAYQQLIASLSGVEGLNIRTVEIGGPQDGVAPDGTNAFTTLAENLADVAPDRLGAVIMLTDGQIHDMRDQGKALAAGVPLHVLLSGRDNERDRRIVLEQAPAFGLVNNEQTIRFRVVDDGVAPGEAAGPVTVNVTADGQVIGTREVLPGESVEMKVNLPHAGANIITLEAAPLAGELTAVNNRAVAEIKGVRDRLRVLLVSGAPNAGERSWRALLKSDPSLDLIHFTILRNPLTSDDSTPVNEMSLIAFPSRELFEEKINEFDLIVFDHYQANGVLPSIYLDNIARYVENGGALMVVSGPDFAQQGNLHDTPLGRILPVVPTGQVTEQQYVPEVSALGQRHPVTRGLPGAEQNPPPWGRWFRVVDSTVAGNGTVLMEGAQDKPLLVLGREEKGRVGVILSDDAWLWARGYENGGPYASLMQRVSHWLMKEPALEEEALRLSVAGGQLTVERQTMAESVDPVRVISPSGEVQTVTLSPDGTGRWTATVPATELGLYRAEQGDKSAITSAGPASPKEFIDARSTPDLLRPAVEQSQGLITRMGEVATGVAVPRIVPVYNAQPQQDMAGTDWIGLRMSAASDLKGTNRYSPFSGWLAFTLVVGLLAGAYLREGDKAGRKLADSARKMWGRDNSGPSI